MIISTDANRSSRSDMGLWATGSESLSQKTIYWLYIRAIYMILLICACFLTFSELASRLAKYFWSTFFAFFN